MDSVAIAVDGGRRSKLFCWEIHMSNAKEPSDKTLINMGAPYEVNYWQARFGVTNAKLQTAIDRVGNNASDVEAWLKKAV